MSLFGIAAIQMEVAARDNRGRMRELIAETRQRFPWVRLVLFSELCALGNDLSAAAAMPGPVEQSFCEMAAEFGIWLVPGSLLEVADGNTNGPID